MPDSNQNWSLLSTWQDELDSLLGQRSDITGAPNFSMGGMSADQKSALDGIDRAIGDARRMIIQLGGDSTATATRRAISVDNTLY